MTEELRDSLARALHSLAESVFVAGYEAGASALRERDHLDVDASFLAAVDADSLAKRLARRMGEFGFTLVPTATLRALRAALGGPQMDAAARAVLEAFGLDPEGLG